MTTTTDLYQVQAGLVKCVLRIPDPTSQRLQMLVYTKATNVELAIPVCQNELGATS